MTLEQNKQLLELMTFLTALRFDMEVKIDKAMGIVEALLAGSNCDVQPGKLDIVVAPAGVESYFKNAGDALGDVPTLAPMVQLESEMTLFGDVSMVENDGKPTTTDADITEPVHVENASEMEQYINCLCSDQMDIESELSWWNNQAAAIQCSGNAAELEAAAQAEWPASFSYEQSSDQEAIASEVAFAASFRWCTAWPEQSLSVNDDHSHPLPVDRVNSQIGSDIPSVAGDLCSADNEMSNLFQICDDTTVEDSGFTTPLAFGNSSSFLFSSYMDAKVIEAEVRWIVERAAALAFSDEPFQSDVVISTSSNLMDNTAATNNEGTPQTIESPAQTANNYETAPRTPPQQATGSMISSVSSGAKNKSKKKRIYRPPAKGLSARLSQEQVNFVSLQRSKK
ncbi:hypothetical protein HDU77_003455 [Chytriomyces hyalinus]|nr:hypothetical protein HDU77_003455 [Chytriomyces hyalinus]